MDGLREVNGFLVRKPNHLCVIYVGNPNEKITIVITYLILLSRGEGESPVFKRD